jgi:hypothetical protein
MVTIVVVPGERRRGAEVGRNDRKCHQYLSEL